MSLWSTAAERVPMTGQNMHIRGLGYGFTRAVWLRCFGPARPSGRGGSTRTRAAGLRHWRGLGTGRSLVIESVEQGEALCTLVEVVQIIDHHVRQGTHNGAPSLYTSFSVESADRLRAIALQKIVSAATEGELLEVPDPASVLVEWRAWGDSADIRRWLAGVVASNETLPRLLVRFVQRGMSTVVGDRVGRISASINPRMFSPELDLDAVEVRVQAAAQMPGLPSSEREAAQLFLAGMTRIGQRRGALDPTD